MRGKVKLALLVAVVALSVALIAAGLAGAHARTTQAGLSFVFGGMSEPVITGERQWLELRASDAVSGEAVEGLEADDALTITISNGEWSRKLVMKATHGKPGSYKVPVWFITPGKYDVAIHGQNAAGEAFDLAYHVEVGDHRDLFFPPQ